MTSFPSDLTSEPSQRIWISAPFGDKKKICVRLTNESVHPVAWMLKTNASSRLSSVPSNGVIQAKQTTILYVYCEPFDYLSQDTSKDQISLEWILAKGNVFNKDWFQDDGVIMRRRNMPVQYNT